MLTTKQTNVLNDLVYTTKTISQISEDNDISRVSIYNWLNKNEEFNDELNKKLAEQEKWVKNQFKKNIQIAHDEVLDIVRNSKDEKVRLSAARYYIDRSLGTPSSKIEMNSNLDVNAKVQEEDILAAFEEQPDSE